MFHQLKVCLILVKNALHLFHLQARKFSMQILFREHDVTGEIIFIIIQTYLEKVLFWLKNLL